MNGPWCRLLRLAILAMLRGAGLLPWLIMVLGVAWSTLLEPAVLRRSGLPLIETSAHALALVALVAVALGGSTMPRLQDRILANGLLTFLVAAVMGLAVAIALTMRGQPVELWSLTEGSLRFLLAWWPLAATVQAVGHGWRTTALLCVQVILGASVATTSLSGVAVLFSVLSLGSALAIEPKDPSGQYANRYSW